MKEKTIYALRTLRNTKWFLIFLIVRIERQNEPENHLGTQNTEKH
jgi:hypothetical protein